MVENVSALQLYFLPLIVKVIEEHSRSDLDCNLRSVIAILNRPPVTKHLHSLEKLIGPVAIKCALVVKYMATSLQISKTRFESKKIEKLGLFCICKGSTANSFPHASFVNDLFPKFDHQMHITPAYVRNRQIYLLRFRSYT